MYVLILAVAFSLGLQAQNTLQMKIHVVDQNGQLVPNWTVNINAYGNANFNVNAFLPTDGFGKVDTLISYPSSLNYLHTYASTRGCDGTYAGVGDTLIPGGPLVVNDTIVVNCPGTPANCSLSFTSTINPSTPATVKLSRIFYLPPNTTSSYVIDFGDGTSGTDPQGSHTYTQTGTYQICMTATAVDTNYNLTLCDVTVCDSVTITSLTPTYTCNAQISSSASPTAMSPYRAYFTNQTSHNVVPAGGSVTKTYNFGDGNSAVAQTGVGKYHNYSSPGVYFPCVTIEIRDASNNIVCSSSDCDSLYISTPAQTVCNANINLNQLSNSYLTVNATSTGSSVQNLPAGGYVRTYYDFGNGYTGPGTPTSNRHFRYSQPGLYSVCLMQVAFDANSDTLCISYDCDSINVTVPYNCQASFTLDTANSGNGTVYLWNTSTWDSSVTNVYQWWDFGDGDTAGGAFPTHIYNSPGAYYVCLSLYTTGPAGVCQSSFCDTLTVDSAGNVVFKNGNSFTLIVQDPSTIGIEENFTVSKMNMYPNPADEYVTISGAGRGELKWQLIDMKGTAIGRGTERINGDESFSIDVSAYPKGLYILRLENGKVAEHYKLKLNR